MRIQGASGPTVASSAPGTRRSTGSAFSIPHQEAETAASGTASSLRMVGGIDALMALQGVEDPSERRRRSVKRGQYALDVLEELKLGILSGALDGSALTRLKAAAVGLKDVSGDSRLDGVLAEIELRVEVEIAKLRPNSAA